MQIGGQKINNCSFWKNGASNLRKICKYQQQNEVYQEIYTLFRLVLCQWGQKIIILSQFPMQGQISFYNSSNSIQQEENEMKGSQNDLLCISFQGLLKAKNQDNEETHHTCWNSNKVKIIEGVAPQQQQGSRKNIIKQQQLIDQEKKLLQRKKQFIQKRNFKVNKLQQILPYYYTIKLPDCLQQILTFSTKIDSYLTEKKKAQYAQNIQNILNLLFSEEEKTKVWSSVRQILFICQKHYRIELDPLKNLTIGFYNKKDTHLAKRKQRLRKQLCDFYIQHKNQVKITIPEGMVYPQKTHRFYPQKVGISNSKKQSTSVISKTKQIQDNLKKKAEQNQKRTQQQEENSSKQTAFPLDLSCQQFAHLCELIIKVYEEKRVKNMYKSSLIGQLRKKSYLPIQKIFKTIRVICSEQLFLEPLTRQNLHIFKLHMEEKQTLFQTLSAKKIIF